MQSSEDIGSTFGRAWQLLSGNWNIAVPAIVLGIIGGILTHLISTVFIRGGAAVGSLGAIFMGGFLTLAIAIVVAILTIGMTTGMGLAAWRTGRADISDGTAVFSNGGAVATLLAWMILGIVLGLIPVLGWIADMVLMFLLIYAIPAAVVTGQGAAPSFGESINMVTRNFLPTLIIVLLIAVIGFCGVLVGGAVSFVPFLGKIVATIIQEVVLAYGMLVICGEYLKMKATAPAPPTA